MQVRCLDQFAEFPTLTAAWNRLAGDRVFQNWQWCSTWWRHYGPQNDERRRARQLMALLVLDEDAPAQTEPSRAISPTGAWVENLVAVAPWFRSHSRRFGNVVRFLGSGEVCADHLSILCRPGRETQAMEAIASYMLGCESEWDLLELTAVDDGDATIGALVDALHKAGCRWNTRPGAQCWQIDLPPSWDEFLAGLSKSHRKQLRRLERQHLSSSEAQWHLATDDEEFEVAWRKMVDLHQQRRQSLGEKGCFASETFHDFHYDLARQLLQQGQLRLSWLELGGEPIAAEYDFATQNATFGYQSGISTAHLEKKPGQLAMIYSLEQAIHEHHAVYDLLRGDEPYKSHWRAQPHGTHEFRIAPPRATAQLRQQANMAVSNVAGWLQSGVHLMSNIASREG